MKRLLTIGLFSVSLLFSYCQGGGSKETGDTDTTETAEEAPKDTKPSMANVDSSLSAHAQEIFSHYIHVKTALVNSNAGEAQNGAKAILLVIEGFNSIALPAEQKAAYDKSISGIKTNAEAVARQGALEQQRISFSDLSNSTYALVKAFGVNKTIYHDHCPMALNDKGANWLSEEKDIKNPYFGEEMMECGSVEEVIHSK